MKSIQEIEAGLELDSDEEILRAQLDTANARIAELERVQGVLVEALETYMQEYNEHWQNGMPILEPMGDAAIAAAQKPASLRDMTEADFDAVMDVGAQKPEVDARDPELCVHALSANDDMELLCCKGIGTRMCNGPCADFEDAFEQKPEGGAA